LAKHLAGGVLTSKCPNSVAPIAIRTADKTILYT
jgi:hypothetical protein